MPSKTLMSTGLVRFFLSPDHQIYALFAAPSDLGNPHLSSASSRNWYRDPRIAAAVANGPPSTLCNSAVKPPNPRAMAMPTWPTAQLPNDWRKHRQMNIYLFGIQTLDSSTTFGRWKHLYIFILQEPSFILLKILLILHLSIYAFHPLNLSTTFTASATSSTPLFQNPKADVVVLPVVQGRIQTELQQGLEGRCPSAGGHHVAHQALHKLAETVRFLGATNWWWLKLPV